MRSNVWDSVSPGGIGGLLELTQGGAHYDYLYDGKGNVAALTDSGQNVVAAYRYDGFGVLKAKSGTLVQPYQFSTKRYYAALGMVKYEYRDYLPALGKWAERDPLGEASDVNLYRAMGNSAGNKIDPDGLKIKLIGSPEEIKLLLKYLSIIAGTKMHANKGGYVSGDFCSPKDFKGIEVWLKDIISSDKIVRIQFGETIYGGKFVDGDAFIEPRNPNATYWAYDGFLSGHREDYRAEQLLAHELLGHGSEWARGGPGSPRGLSSGEWKQYERQAIDRENNVNRLLRWPIRGE